jgi:hypothetical protein
MRLRNTATTRYISCIGCKHYDYGLCKKTHEFELITEKKMYPLASSYREKCGYKNPKHYASIDLKNLEKLIKMGNNIVGVSFFITPISIISLLIYYDFSAIFIGTTTGIAFASWSFGSSCDDLTQLYKKRLELINEFIK